MGGIIVIRGKITTQRAYEGDEYADSEVHLTLTIPAHATAAAEGKAVKLARRELLKFYDTLGLKLGTIDFGEDE